MFICLSSPIKACKVYTSIGCRSAVIANRSLFLAAVLVCTGLSWIRASTEVRRAQVCMQIHIYIDTSLYKFLCRRTARIYCEVGVLLAAVYIHV